ncbi:hypothetical protein Y5S_00178 [Alcanivorax nanhaiticus]|uniref:Uncharacterized protein n=1 Tax=Alcanivorax nanhaiticus TaxID=1177154 RepID=A0A095SPB3_9GAMM|nr:hypothetical protein Y5S_00178 [Alcanivorax nanhaiticus]
MHSMVRWYLRVIVCNLKIHKKQGFIYQKVYRDTRCVLVSNQNTYIYRLCVIAANKMRLRVYQFVA